MNKASRKRINPFYVILVVAGVAFVITACAYFVMALKQMHAGDMWVANQPAGGVLEQQAVGSERFVELMDLYGVNLMIGEIAILGLATCAAIATDRFWAE